MTKKDYEKAATIVRDACLSGGSAWQQRTAIENAFVELFKGDNPQFDEARFRAACQPKNKK